MHPYTGMRMQWVGTSPIRKDAVEKVTGSAKFIEDLHIGPMLYAKIKKSPFAHAKIKKIDVSEAEKYPGVKAVVTGRDFPNRVGLYLVDRTFFAVDKVRHVGEPVAAVAAVSEKAAQEAVELIKVEYEELPGVFDPKDALKPDAPLVHENLGEYEVVPAFFPKPGTNISNHFKLRKGDIKKGFGEGDVILEREYHIPHMQLVTLETHKAAALWEPEGKLTVWSTAQSPFTVRQLLGQSLGMPLHKIRVVSSYIGGGFGGKAGATMEGLVIPLAQRCPGHVVRLAFSREEDIQGSFVRQALYSRLKMAAKRDGRITALEYEMIWDGGAYTEYGVNIVRNAGYNSTGPYEIPNVKTDSYCVYTNNPVGGPVRGFGLSEMHWGLERHMDEMAKQLDLDRLEFRLINAMRSGSETAARQKVWDVSYVQSLQKVADAINWKEKGAQEKKHKLVGKGISGLVKAPSQPSNASSSAIIKMNEDGTAQLLVGTAEMGTGTFTALAQIASEVLRIPVENISMPLADTDFTPYEWQTVASRSVYSMGNAIIAAAEDVKSQIFSIASRVLQSMGVFDRIPEEELLIKDGYVCWVKDQTLRIPLSDITNCYCNKEGRGMGGPIIGRGCFFPSKTTNLDPETGEGNPGLFYTFGATAAEVEVDVETGEVKVLQLATAVDCGKAINPALCHTQIHGGNIMGLSTVLYEDLRLKNGWVLNPNFTDYKICTIENAPKINAFLLETPEIGGPFDARGLAEKSMIGVAPAIANAVSNALGVNIRSFPLSPERIVKVWREKAKESK